MKITTTQTIETIKEIDLHSVPVSQWPEAAKEAARSILTRLHRGTMRGHKLDAIYNPATGKALLVQLVEADLEFMASFSILGI